MANNAYHSFFTPSLSDHETLEALFVAREQLAERIMTGIRESSENRDKLQVLLLGPRGIGKTHLVSLLYHRVKNDNSLSDLLRIAWLPEDSYLAGYQDLLMLILRQLQNEYSLTELDRQLENVLDLNDAGQAELALEQLLLNNLNGKSLLLIVENLDSILSDLKESGQRKLRAFVQNNPVVTILGTATTLSNAIAERKKTFFGFFKIHTLEPFTTNQAANLLAHLAKRTEKLDLVKAINSPMGKARIRAVHYLAGGNPRIYIIFFNFLTRDTLDDLVQPFMKLIDDLTPYYQSRMDKLAPLQRRIIDILRRLKGAVTVKEVARQAMNTSQTISAQLGKLVELGYVIQADSTGRSNYYEIREPLMRLCLEVKEQRGRNVELFVAFLRVWYSKSEMEGILESGCDGAEMKYMQQATLLTQTEQDPLKKSLESEFINHQHAGDYNAALEATEIAIERDPNDKDNWKRKAQCLEKLSKPLEEQLNCLEKVVDIDPEDMLAWNQLDLLHGQLGNYEDALVVSGKALALKPDDHILQRNYGYALKNLGRQEESLEFFEKAIELLGKPSTANQWFQRGYTLLTMERQVEALNAYIEALKLDHHNIDAWNQLLGLLQEQGRFKLYHCMLGRLVKLLPDEAKLQYYLGIAFSDLGLHEQALTAYETAFEMDPKLEDNGIPVTLYRARSLNYLGMHSKALEALERCSTSMSNDIAFRHALIKAHNLMCLDRWVDGKAQLEVSLNEYSSKHLNGWGLTIISILIQQSQNPEVWRRFILVWLELFAKHGCLTYLGDGLVRRMRSLAIPFISNEASRFWVAVWQELASEYEEMYLPLRLLNAGVEYKVTRDSKVLLALAGEERKLLEPWLINMFKKEPDEIDHKMEDLMAVVERRLSEDGGE